MRAITRFSIGTGATRMRVIARMAGSYSASIATCADLWITTSPAMPRML
jgi:hypothetical protein